MTRCVIRVRETALALLISAALVGGCNTNQGTSTETATPAPAQSEASPEPAPPAAAPPEVAKPSEPPAAAPAEAAKPAATPKPAPAKRANPVVVVETNKGTFSFETYPQDAPKTVEHILALVKRNFYNGQRIHRVEPGFVIQFGDPTSRDMSQQYRWGQGGSGSPIGVAEIKRNHKLGAVAMAHAGAAAGADSQMYVSLSTEATAQLDGKYTVFGQVISGMSVVQKIAPLDVIKKMSVKE